MKIAVFGSAAFGKNQADELAKEIGKEIAKAGAILVSGGTSGLPYVASKAALDNGGKTLGYSPVTDIEKHKAIGKPVDGYSQLVFVPEDFKFADNVSVCMKYRNVISCAESDACVIIGGRIGTVNEFTNMYDMGKIIGVMEGSGGCTEYLQNIIDVANKDSGALVIFEKDPKKLIEKIVEAIQDGTD